MGKKKKKSGNYLLSHYTAVPSAFEGLTSVFGMGTGVTPQLLSPDKLYSKKSVVTAKCTITLLVYSISTEHVKKNEKKSCTFTISYEPPKSMIVIILSWK